MGYGIKSSFPRPPQRRHRSPSKGNSWTVLSLFYTFFCQPTLQIASNLLDQRHKEQWSELQKVIITKQYVSAYTGRPPSVRLVGAVVDWNLSNFLFIEEIAYLPLYF